MKRILSLLILCTILCSTQTLYAEHRSDKLKPKWVTQTLPESKSEAYFFVRTFATGNSLAAAKQMAFVNLTYKLESERNITLNTTLEVRDVMTHTIERNHDNTESISRQEFVIEATERGEELHIVCREIDDYWVYRNGMYEVNVLYTVSNKSAFGGSNNDNIVVTTKYPAAGFMSVVPGVAQLYKGSTIKGGLILGGEILAAGGILLCENTRASYIKKMYEQPKYAREYNSLADNWETSRNICIGAAAAIYVYNLIDGFVADGAKRVVVKQKRYQFSAMPYSTHNSVGMSLALTF